MFAVIKVYSWYDGPEDVECLGTFSTSEEAEAHIKTIKEIQRNSWLKKKEYIDNYVDNIQMPEAGYDNWLKFIQGYFGEQCSYVFPKDFKDHLKGGLSKGTIKVKDCNPPEHDSNYLYLFVLEIK